LLNTKGVKDLRLDFHFSIKAKRKFETIHQTIKAQYEIYNLTRQ